MDVRTPVLILLCSLLAAFALSVLGLAADNVAFVNKHRDGKVTLHYLRWNPKAEAQFSYWVQIDYLPSRYDMSGINAMLAASIITLFVGVGVAVASWKSRASKAVQTGSTEEKSKHSKHLPLVSFILAFIAFAISLAVAVYAWYPVMKWDIDFKNSLPLPPSVTGSKSKTVKYQSPFDLVPDVWNCWISDYAVDPALAGRLRTLCREASVAKTLMLPVFVLSALLMIGTGLSWYKASCATSTTKTEANEKEMDEVSVEEAST